VCRAPRGCNTRTRTHMSPKQLLFEIGTKSYFQRTDRSIDATRNLKTDLDSSQNVLQIDFTTFLKFHAKNIEKLTFDDF